MSETSPVELFGGADQRCEVLLEALIDLIHERTGGMPIPSVLGVLRILEHKILEDGA